MKKELIKRIEALPAKDGKGRPFVDKKMVIGLIQTMDEPKQPTLDNIIHRIKFMEEDLKQEWLSKILKELGSDFELKKFQEGFKTGSWIGRQLINADKIQQKLNKPVIPQFVADWIDYCKRHNFTLFGCLDPEGGFESLTNETFKGDIRKCIRWCRKESNIFARAWLYGYEVEKEKRYIVSLKNGQPLVKAPLGGNFYFNQNITAGNCKATRKELEDAGFGWVFDCPGIEIEEVEE